MKAVITLDENAPAKVQIDKNGLLRTVHLDMQDLINYIISSVREEDYQSQEQLEVVTFSPTLPPNTIKYAKISDDTDLIFLFHPETKANVTYHKTVFENVPFPNLVFCFGVRNKRLVGKFVAAYKDKFLRDTTELYRFPFSNVFSGSNLCYNTNQEFHDLVQLQTFPYNWLREPFNDHLYAQGKNNSLNLSLREIFEKSQNQTFNYDMLIPLDIAFSTWSESLI